MDEVLSVSALCAAVTFIVEMLKSWLPCKYKCEKGITWKRGRKRYVLPNQAVWPAVSALVGAGLFLLLHFDPLGLGGYAGQAISGVTAGTAGGSAVFRIKNKAGSAMGGNDETSAQNTGPSTGTEV